MTTTVEFPITVRRGKRGARRMRDGRAPTPKPVEPGRVPRIARLMALAIRLDGLVRSGAVRDFADLARLGRVSRARVSQIMNLLALAPDIQEALLFLPRTVQGRDPVTERQVRAVAALADWGEQRIRWAACQSREAWGSQEARGSGAPNLTCLALPKNA